MKKFFALFLSLTMVMGLSVSAFAAEPMQVSCEVDDDVAATIATQFVWSNLDASDVWTDETSIADVVPMYDTNDQINAYYVGFTTNQVPTGYVIVSTNLDESLVQEYSDTASSLNVESESEPVSTLRSNSAHVYYYGPLAYSTVKHESTNYLSSSPETQNASLRQQNEAYVSLLKETGLIPHDYKNGGGGKFISSPLTYLREKYPSSTCSIDDRGHMVSGVSGYTFSEHNGCSVNGTAAILQFHLGSGYSFNSVRDVCKKVAVDNGYATSSNYYISVGDLAPYIRDCIAKYPALKGKTAHSSLLSWSTGTSEINADRPVLLNIAASEQYANHTVFAFGWSTYKVTGHGSIKFFAVKDGYTTSTRYVNYDTVTGSYITKVY